MSAVAMPRSGLGAFFSWLSGLFGKKIKDREVRAAEPAPMVQPMQTGVARAAPPMAEVYVAPAAVEAATSQVSAPAVPRSFMLAARAASVGRLNTPVSRSVKRKRISAPAGKQIPVKTAKVVKPKPVLQHTAIAGRKPSLSRPAAAASAVVIDLASAKRSRRNRSMRPAA